MAKEAVFVLREERMNNTGDVARVTFKFSSGPSSDRINLPGLNGSNCLPHLVDAVALQAGELSAFLTA